MGDLFGTRTFFKNSKIEIIPYFPAFRCYSCSRSSPVHVYLCKKIQSFNIILTNTLQFNENYTQQISRSIFHKPNCVNKLLKTNSKKQIKQSISKKQISQNKFEKTSLTIQIVQTTMHEINFTKQIALNNCTKQFLI